MNIDISGFAFLIGFVLLFIASLVLGIVFTRKKKKVAAIISFSVFGILLALLIYVIYLIAQVI